MKVDILTAIPGMFESVFDLSILGRGQDKGLVNINVHDLREWSTDRYKSIDDRPYGGGAGMVLRIDIIDRAIQSLEKGKVVLLDAGGRIYDQSLARGLAHDEHLILICGHYEGVDHRVHEYLADEVISIGKYVLSGGEIAAMVVIDSVVRLLPGVLGNPNSLDEESFNRSISNAKLVIEYPQYTRPEEYRKWKVPGVLLTGNHAKIATWRKSQLAGNE